MNLIYKHEHLNTHSHYTSQQAHNVEIWTKLQRWKLVAISTLKYGPYLNIDDGWKMVVSLIFSWLWNNDCVLFISISTFYLLDNHQRLTSIKKVKI